VMLEIQVLALDRHKHVTGLNRLFIWNKTLVLVISRNSNITSLLNGLSKVRTWISNITCLCLSKARTWIFLTSHVCACPKPGPGFLTWC
jgi:hypothetical protein